ncbi:TPA: AAA family ATPase, partial [Clostridium botulinum]|nr:AAA family ATPase [Clostridium botulinum]
DKTYLNYTVELEESLIDNANDFIINSENSMNENNNIELNVGDRIIHKSFGFGRVIEVDITNSSYVIKFDNSETYRNISFSMQLEKTDSDNLKNNFINEKQNKKIEVDKKSNQSEWLEAEKIEKERQEAERLKVERIEKERQEAERLEVIKAEQKKLEEKRLEAEIVLKIQNEIAKQEIVVSENKYKFFGRGAALKKEARAKIKELYQKLDEMPN